MKALYAAIDDQIKNYQQGTIRRHKFSMSNTVRQITHYNNIAVPQGSQLQFMSLQRLTVIKKESNQSKAF
jgi:hypothetical protein